jgi:hypothetical protein
MLGRSSHDETGSLAILKREAVEGIPIWKQSNRLIQAVRFAAPDPNIGHRLLFRG